MDNQTLKLKYPIQAADRTIEEITMRRPTLKDLRTTRPKSRDDFDGEVRHLAALCDLRVEDMDGMDSVDFGRLQNLYISFRLGTEFRDGAASDFDALEADSLAAQ